MYKRYAKTNRCSNPTCNNKFVAFLIINNGKEYYWIPRKYKVKMDDKSIFRCEICNEELKINYPKKRK